MAETVLDAAEMAAQRSDAHLAGRLIDDWNSLQSLIRDRQPVRMREIAVAEVLA